MIKLFTPTYNNYEIKSVIKTIKSDFWASGAGIRNVKKFEEKFKKFTQASECVAVDSGTAALHLALNVSDVYKKQVLVPSLTFVSTVHAIRYNGGIPIFVDINPDTLCMDPNDLENKISDKTKVILPVHFGGFPCDLNPIQRIARSNNLIIVDDAAHACGAKYNDREIGSLCDFTCFSFHPVKNLSMPKGGAITINSKNPKNFKNRLNSLRWCGISNRKGSFYDITDLGFNYYMDEISAAIGIEQMKKLKKLNQIRFEIAKTYHNELKISEKIPLSRNCTYHLYWLIVKDRKKFMNKMKEKGIETGSHYTPVHHMSFYKSKHSVPITDKIHNKIVTIPIHPRLSDREIDHIIKTVNSAI